MNINLSFSFLAYCGVVVLSACVATPPKLDVAIRNEDLVEVRRLIDSGEDINKGDESGFKPICLASIGGSDEIVTLLINRGVDVNATCANGIFTPLQVAALTGNTYMVKALLANGAKIDLVNTQGMSAVMVATLHDRTETANYLIKKGADPLRRNVDGETATEMKIRQAAEIDNWQKKKTEQERQDKAESKEFWKGAGALATGIAVGNATKGYSPDQQDRMMKSSIKGVMDGDASEFHATSEQVMAEAQQENNAKIKAIQDQRVRDQKPADVKRTQVNAYDQTAPRFTPLTNVDRKNYRCADSFTASSAPRWTKAEASEEALRYAKVDTYGTLGLKTLSSEITSCKFESGLGYTCIAKTKFERDSTVPCTSGPKAPSEGVSK